MDWATRIKRAMDSSAGKAEATRVEVLFKVWPVRAISYRELTVNMWAQDMLRPNSWTYFTMGYDSDPMGETRVNLVAQMLREDLGSLTADGLMKMLATVTMELKHKLAAETCGGLSMM